MKTTIDNVKADDKIISQIEQYILSPAFYLRSYLSVSVCAGELNMTTNLFVEYVKHSFGHCNLEQLSHELRVEEAKELLVQGFTMRQTATWCGYLSILRFIFYFKKITSMYPWIWRREYSF